MVDIADEIRVPEWINCKGVHYESTSEQENQAKSTINLDKEFKNLIIENKKSKQFKVIYTERSIQQLSSFHSKNAVEDHKQEFLIEDIKELKNVYLNCSRSSECKDTSNISESFNELKCKFCFQFLESTDQARNAIENILLEDPRSSYRRTKCSDRLYYFTLDTMHITCWFDEEDKIVEVVKIKPNYL